MAIPILIGIGVGAAGAALANKGKSVPGRTHFVPIDDDELGDVIDGKLDEPIDGKQPA